MRFRVIFAFLLSCFLLTSLTAQTSAPDKQKFSPPSRKFRFTY